MIRWTQGRKWLVPAIMIAAAFCLGFMIRGGGDHSSGPGVREEPSETAAPRRWTCSMHPQIILPDNDRKCPICFMDLIPIEEDTAAGLGPANLVLSKNAAALAEIATEPVRRRFVTRDIRLVGKVATDETRTRTITARVGGRVDRLLAAATGQTVTQGMKLAEIYSPALYSAQMEMQTAAAALRGADSEGARANLESTAERLRLWGLDDQQIQAIRRGEGVAENVSVLSPTAGVVVSRQVSEGDHVQPGDLLYTISDLSGVWVVLEAFETDVAWLREGQSVKFTARAYAGRDFAGEIQFIDPVLDERTRTIEVRVAVDNSTGLLKPGMLVSGSAAVTVDAYGQPVTDPATAVPPLVIPASAPLMTGNRAVVYVRRPGAGDPEFSGRGVVLGPRAGDFYFVVSGLSEGEIVVTRGSFKIDSALQIQAKTSMMNPADPVEEKPDPQPELNGLTPFHPGPCFGLALGEVLVAYYPLQQVLAADDDVSAAAAAAGVAAAVKRMTCRPDELPPAGAELWVRLKTALEEAAIRTAAADNIARRREAFETLSDNLWNTMARFGTGSETPVRRFHCPMAFDNDGAHWIQEGDTTANPYYGAMMLRCGSQKEILDHQGGGS